MTVLIKRAQIIAPDSQFHLQTADILIENGRIAEMGSGIEVKAGQIIEEPGLHVSPGWIDIFADFADPGYEFRETLESGSSAAAAGGYTDVMLMPGTNPPVNSRTQVQYLLNKSLPVNIHPLGAVTKKSEGRELTEMYDMYAAGAVAFSDGMNPVQDPGVLLKALQYITAKNTSIIQVPHNKSIAPHGLMHEGITSTRLGLPGIPAMAEEIMIARDIELLRYSNSKLHISGVSTAKGISLIAKAREEGLNITCSVTPYHINFCDEDLLDYDTNLKVNPPLRSRHDMEALKKAVISGDVDCIASHHLPEHSDNKDCEFEYARPGMAGIQTAFSAVMDLFPNEVEKVVRLFTAGRKIFGLPDASFSIGSAACLTIFNPFESYTFTPQMNLSQSANNAFIGKTLKGKVKGIFNKNQLTLYP